MNLYGRSMSPSLSLTTRQDDIYDGRGGATAAGALQHSLCPFIQPFAWQVLSQYAKALHLEQTEKCPLFCNLSHQQHRLYVLVKLFISLFRYALYEH
jgi:hypothetical protein